MATRQRGAQKGSVARETKDDGLLEGFEIYHSQRSQFPRQQQTVTIQKHGALSISSDLGVHLLGDGDGKPHVLLGYNAQRRRIVIIPQEDGTPGALTLRKQNEKSGRWFVDAVGFLEKYGIKHEQRKTCHATWREQEDGQGGVFIDLPPEN